jgi:hypothetical protein
LARSDGSGYILTRIWQLIPCSFRERDGESWELRTGLCRRRPPSEGRRGRCRARVGACRSTRAGGWVRFNKRKLPGTISSFLGFEVRNWQRRAEWWNTIVRRGDVVGWLKVEQIQILAQQPMGRPRVLYASSFEVFRHTSNMPSQMLN